MTVDLAEQREAEDIAQLRIALEGETGELLRHSLYSGRSAGAQEKLY